MTRDDGGRVLDHVVSSAAIAAMAMAGLVLVGWLLDFEVFARIHPAAPSMKTNTAVGIVLVGVSLLLLRGEQPARNRRVAARICAAVVVILAVVSAAQDLFGWNLGIDELLVEERRSTAAAGAPNRMAPNTALAFVLAGAAVLLRDRRRWRRHASQGAAIALAALSFLALIGHLYGASDLFWLGRNTAMALPTALAFLLLSVGLLCSQPRTGIVSLLVGHGLGGHLARRLFPAAILVPTLLGLLRLAGEAAGLYDTEFGTAALISATVLLFGGVTLWSAAALDRLDVQRRGAMRVVEAESKARDLESRRLQAVLDVLPVGVFLADASGRLTEVNPAANAIWNRSAPLAGGIAEYGNYLGWWPDTGEPVKPEQWALARSIARGEVCVAEEVEIQPAGGPRRTILNYATPIRDERGDLAGGVAVNVDITDRKKVERELRALKNELEERVRHRTAELAAANAELEAFSYSVSHDLRAPLRWVDGFTQALAEDYAERLDDKGREYVRQIRESVQRMSELIDALLKLSRITRVPLERADADLSRMARDIASELEADEPTRRVEWDIADDLHAHADPKLARVVVDNLLRNAWKFTRPRELARIQVGGTQDEREHIYFVRDNGVGFDMAYVDKLFRSFERLHRSEAFEGTGVGLALVKRVVQRHGGRAWAEGHLNEGATFYFTLGPPGALP